MFGGRGCAFLHEIHALQIAVGEDETGTGDLDGKDDPYNPYILVAPDAVEMVDVDTADTVEETVTGCNCAACMRVHKDFTRCQHCNHGIRFAKADDYYPHRNHYGYYSSAQGQLRGESRGCA